MTFKTTRIDEMVAWYKAVVGCEVTFNFAGAAWTTNDAANHRIAFLTTPGVKDDPNKIAHSGMHHTAFEFGTHQALFDNYERLAEVGILPHICFDHGLTMSFYYVDPDGNSVELQSDNFGNWIHSSHWMQGSSTRKFGADGAVCCSGRRASRSGAKAESTTRGGSEGGITLLRQPRLCLTRGKDKPFFHDVVASRRRWPAAATTQTDPHDIQR